MQSKRKRGIVSYREPSTDEDLSGSDSTHAATKKRALPVRRSARHQSTSPGQASSRPSERIISAPPSPPPRDQRSLRRRTRRNISYRDDSTDDDDNNAEDEWEETATQLRQQARKRASPRTRSHPVKKTTRSRALVLNVPPSPKHGMRSKLIHDTGSHLTSRIIGIPSEDLCVHIPTDGRKPLLSALPYHILLQIFIDASVPLHDENMTATPAVPWLVNMACMCSEFTKPALTALYRNPPIFALGQRRKDLMYRLLSPTVGSHVDYQVMVKRLEIDATQMAAFTDPLNSVADFASLVATLSTLREIDIFDPFDRPPYRPRLKRIRRWQYPEAIFTTLAQSQLRLRAWRWNREFCSEGFSILETVHSSQAFQSLRELSFVKFNTDKPRRQVEDAVPLPSSEELLGSAIKALPNLRSLVFESCTAMNGKLLPLLPTTLLSLNITNCINVVSEELQVFLAGHGQQLEVLVLNHNQSLDLSFLVDLKNSCPRLEELRIDMHYFSSLVLSNDNEPLYDWLLGLDEIPTWPSSLRVIDLEFLRKWSAAAAVNFFTSLIDSAGNLPSLREINILAMVDIDWRQRADFRRKWAARFERVFARQCPPPARHLASLKAFREWKTGKSEAVEKNDSLFDIVEGDQVKQEPETDSDAAVVPKRKEKYDEKWDSKRLRSRSKGLTNYDETSDSERDSNETSVDDEEPETVQGRCHVVKFRIDNLRPREELYDEADFLDEERSGDEDWDGNDIDDEGEVIAF